MKRHRILILFLLLFLAAVGGFFWQWQGAPASAGNANVYYGNIDIREAQLAFNYAEHVQAVLVEEGDRVEAGQLLATLHDALARARLAEAEARLAAQKAVVAKLEAGSRPEEIERARAELAAARARARSARDTLRRLRGLLGKKLASPEDVENARSLAEAAEANVKAAAATLRLLELGPRKEDIAAARAELAAREAALRTARQRLADTRLLAPAAGIVRRRILEPGDMAGPQVPALTLAFTNPVWARIYVPEPSLGRVRPGMRAEIFTDSDPDKAYPAWVGYVSPTAEFTPKNVETPELRTRLVYEARVFACNPDEGLRLGMPVTVRLLPGSGGGAARPDCSND